MAPLGPRSPGFNQRNALRVRTSMVLQFFLVEYLKLHVFLWPGLIEERHLVSDVGFSA